jgi:hypothetical protein
MKESLRVLELADLCETPFAGLEHAWVRERLVGIIKNIPIQADPFLVYQAAPLAARFDHPTGI